MPKDTIIPINNEIILRASRAVFTSTNCNNRLPMAAAVRNTCMCCGVMCVASDRQLSRSPIEVVKLSMNVVAPV